MDRRQDLYSELAEALGCDAMDSHEGRLRMARDRQRYREALETIARMSSTTKLRNVALAALERLP